uniref:RNA-directed DNA polymerase n=1 Tax=Plectus sambesii TaxID=2011161 RepID=A0A914XHI5_9BILA
MTTAMKKAAVGTPDFEYGGYTIEEYERIFAYKKEGTMPSFEEVEESKHKGKRSTFQHKCADFAISADGTSLMYYKMYKYNCQKKADDGSGTIVEAKKMRVVVHKGEVEQINRSVHEEIVHLMQNNTYKQVKERFYWDTMQEDVRAFVTSCVKCQKSCLKVYACALATRNVNGIDHRVTSAYHPQSNGLTEHTNQTIKSRLQKTLEGRHKEWPKFVNRVLYGIHLHRPRST